MGNCLSNKDQYEYEVQTMMTEFNGDDIKVDIDCSHAMNQTIQEEFQDKNFKVKFLSQVKAYLFLECYIFKIYYPYTKYCKEIEQMLQDTLIKIIKQKPNALIIICGDINKSPFSILGFKDTVGFIFQRNQFINIKKKQN